MDIAERLRNFWRDYYEPSPIGMSNLDTPTIAADEIERLRAALQGVIDGNGDRLDDGDGHAEICVDEKAWEAALTALQGRGDDLPASTQKLIKDRMTSADLLIDELSDGSGEQ